MIDAWINRHSTWTHSTLADGVNPLLDEVPFLCFKEEGCREAVNVGEGEMEEEQLNDNLADVEVVRRDSSSGNSNISSSVLFLKA